MGFVKKKEKLKPKEAKLCQASVAEQILPALWEWEMLTHKLSDESFSYYRIRASTREKPLKRMISDLEDPISETIKVDSSLLENVCI